MRIGLPPISEEPELVGEPTAPASPDCLTDLEYREIFEAKCVDSKTPFSEKLLRRFLKYQRPQMKGKIFELEACGLGTTAAAVIADLLPRHPHFRVLSIPGNFIGDDGADRLAEILYTSRFVSVDLSTNAIGDRGMAAIFRAIRSNNTVFHLHAGSRSGVGRNSIGPTAVAELGHMLATNRILCELDVKMSELFSDTILPVARGLRQNATLQILDISNNNILSKGFIRIVKQLRDTQLREIYFANAHLRDDIGPHLAAFLETNKSLVVLDLSGNLLTNRFCSAVALPLAAESVLEVLNLARNPLGSRGFSMLGPPLRTNTHLLSLDCSNCQGEPAGLRDFCRELKDNATLQRLDLSYNAFMDEVAALAPVIEVHPALREIALESTEMSDAGSVALFSAITKSTSMERVNVRNNLIHNGILVYNAIAGNSRVRACDVELNDIDYKIVLEIGRAVEANGKVWREEQKNIQQSLSTVETSDRLTVVRDSIAAERQTIVHLRERLASSKAELARAGENRTERLTTLEAELNEVNNESVRVTDEHRSGSSGTALSLENKEAEVSGLSTRLARETETFVKETKALSNLEQRINQSKASFVTELTDLNVQLEDAMMRYEDCKRNLIPAWQNVKILEKARSEEEEIAKQAAPAPAGTRKATAKKARNKKKGKG